MKILITPNSEQEKRYCKKYNIDLLRLENGVNIVGTTCQKDSTNWAEIKWTFLEGAYGNIAGTVHFLEHMFNKNINLLARRNALYINASTNALEVKSIVSGVANPNHLDYGVWVVLDLVRKSLESPTRNIENIKNVIETEKQVIKTEIQQKLNNHNYHVNANFQKTIYDRKNPFYNTEIVSGTVSDVDKITLENLEILEKKILLPKQLLISVYSEGESVTTKKILNILKEQFLIFPRTDVSIDKYTKKSRSLLNNTLKNGNSFSFDTGIRNGLITNQFNWIFKYRFGSKEYFTLRLLKNMIANELHQHSRKNGWGYFTEVGVTRPTFDVGILNLRVDAKKDAKIDLLSGIKEVFNQIKTISNDLINLEQKRQLATPMSVSDRFSWVVDGLSELGQIIDADEIRHGMNSVTEKELNALIDKLINTPPITIVTGDLS